MSQATPLVSLVMVVRNGMPYLRDAIASVTAQTYPHFELIVQDGVSTDGSLEFLQAMQTIPHLKLESAADSGPADALNRAFARCRGDIIGSIFADDLLEPTALENAVATFAAHPEAAAIYGGCKMVTATNEEVSIFQPPPFDWLHLLSCALVPPFSASYFSRAVCGDSLQFDEALLIELGFWLRLSHLPIVMTPSVLSRVRISEKSNTCQADLYEQICQDKIDAVKQHLAQYESTLPVREIGRYAIAGIYAWAAESMLWIPTGTPERFDYFYAKAFAIDPNSERLKNLQTQQVLRECQAELAVRVVDRTYNELEQVLCECQAELAAVRAEAAKQAVVIDRTYNDLEQAQQASNQAKHTLQQTQAALAHAQTTIAAMQSSKFWQLRMQWLKLKQKIGSASGKHNA